MQNLSLANVAHSVAFRGQLLPLGINIEVIARARLAALRAVLGEDSVIHYAVHRAPEARTAAKPARRSKRGAEMSAPAFWAAYAAAVASIREQYGANWKITAPLYKTVLVTLPAKLRSYKSDRGVTIKYRADHRIPGPGFWPCELPAGLVLSVDPERADGAGSITWQLRRDYRVVCADFMRACQYLRRVRRGWSRYPVEQEEIDSRLSDATRLAGEWRDLRTRIRATGEPVIQAPTVYPENPMIVFVRQCREAQKELDAAYFEAQREAAEKVEEST